MVKKVILNICDVYVSSEPAILQTVLGSCVSVCLWDEQLRIGGMNHFMLPQASFNTEQREYCGCESINELVVEMLRTGADIRRLRAKLFGGGKLLREFTENLDIGKENIKAAKVMLKKYGIPVTKEFTEPGCGIKVIFYTATGRAFVKRLGEMHTADDKH